ncbi:hypothetical protein TNCT_173641 [Trichonephila clavata]|uniref:Uncharacterized protein n=1 Tax=Trichonephila clavata TaxID=2740835 RepID=A0A8X6G366_TRICU|nr:hypothetical protein TNCT_173641 [Trichonephila clavata]
MKNKEIARKNNENRKGIDLQQKKDVLCLHPKGEGKPTMIISAAKKHIEQDYFTNKFQSYDKYVHNKTAEELCSFQGKITSVFEDELDPNFKATPSSSRMSEEEINRNVKDLSEYKLKPPNLSLSEMLDLLPPDDSNLEVIEPPTKKQKTN